MKLLYATSISFPSYQTNRLQIIQMSQEFQSILKENFVLGGKDIKIKEDSRLNIKNIEGSSRSFLLSLKYLFFIKKNKFTHIYCREEKLLFFLIFYNKLFFRLPLKFIYEAHDFNSKKSFWYKYILEKSDKVIVLTKYIKSKFAEVIQNTNNVFVSPDGVNIKKFDIEISKEEARKKLNLPLGKKIIVYIGLLYEWKGVQTLAESSQYLSDNSMIVFVGGKEHHVEDFKNKNIRYKNILLVGSRPHEEMPFWIKSADVVVLPNTAKEDISKYYTSPLKMFEYMAGKTPIVASDLPSIREILNEGNAVLVEPDNSKKLAEGISRILNNNELGVKISEQSFFDVQNYTWRERSEQVIDFIK